MFLYRKYKGFTFMIISEMGGSSKKNINFGKLVDRLRTIDDQVNFLQVTIFHKCSFNLCIDFRNKIFFHPLSHVNVVILSSLKFILTVDTISFIANLAKRSSLSDPTPSSAMLTSVCANSYFLCTSLLLTSGVTRMFKKKLILLTVKVLMMKM